MPSTADPQPVLSKAEGAPPAVAGSWQELFRRFADIGVRLSTERDLDALLALILREARRLTRADAGSLYVVAGRELVFRVSQNDTLSARDSSASLGAGGAGESQFHDFRFPLSAPSIAGSVALSGETLNIPDCQRHPRHNKSVDEKLGYTTRTMLVVPMRTHTAVIGVLQLINALDAQGAVQPFPARNHLFIESLASQAAVCLENAQLFLDLQNVFDALVKMCAKAIDARDPCTAGHSSRVAAYALRVARELGGYTPEQLRELRYAAFLHDIGKIGVREHVLTKQHKLYPAQLEALRERLECYRLAREVDLYRARDAGQISAEEFAADRAHFRRQADEIRAFLEKVNIPSFLPPESIARLHEIAAIRFPDAAGGPRPLLAPEELEALLVVKGNLTAAERKDIESHVVHTDAILRAIPFKGDLAQVATIAGRHHEKLNGAGYPRGLKADDLPLGARILAVVDVYEALTAQDRPYKPPMPAEQALAILDLEVKDGHFDPTVVDALRRVIAQGAARAAGEPAA